MRALLLTAFALLVAAVAAQSPCAWTDTNGNRYNFAGLQAATDYSVVDTHQQTYALNVCKAVQSCGGKSSVGVCQTDNHGNALSAGAVPGTFSQGSVGVGQGATLTYNGGDICLGNPRTSILQLKCDQTVQTPTAAFVQESPPCTYTISITSKYACPGAPGGPGGGLSGGWVFVIIYLVGFTVYCIVGFIYKMQRQGARGLEAVPNVDFWKDLPSLVKDGFKYIGSKTCCRNVSYSTV